jgi:hypothetical protein
MMSAFGAELIPSKYGTADFEVRTSIPVSAKLRLVLLVCAFFFFSFTGFTGLVSPGLNTSSGS